MEDNFSTRRLVGYVFAFILVLALWVFVLAFTVVSVFGDEGLGSEYVRVHAKEKGELPTEAVYGVVSGKVVLVEVVVRVSPTTVMVLPVERARSGVVDATRRAVHFSYRSGGTTHHTPQP